MKKIKVLQFPIGNTKGGITHYIMTNFKYIDKSRFHFDFATLIKTIDFEDYIIKDAGAVHRGEKDKHPV